MKRKKIWIILVSVILGVVALCTGLHFATKLSSVSVEFRTRLEKNETRLESGILDNVKASGEFNYKKSVLFMNTSKNIEKIEKANPYVKVQQVIRKFPNKLCIYISERIPKYRIQDSESSDKWFILDEDFKVLDCVSSSELESEGFMSKTVEVSFIQGTTYIGDFFDKQEEMKYLNEILSGVYGRTKDYFAVKSINYDVGKDTFYLTMKDGFSENVNYENGCEIQIVGSDDLYNKVFRATYVYVDFTPSENSNIDLSQKIFIICDKNGYTIKN